MEIKKYILEKFENLEESKKVEILKRAIQECNSWNGSLDWLDYQINDEEFFKIYYGDNIDEAVRAVCYGDYNYTDEYVIINAYGNLESLNKYEFENEILKYEEEILDTIEEEKENIDIDYILGV